MNSYYLLDWIGAVTALIGTYVLAFNVSWSRWGWVVYFLSNLAWISYGVMVETWSIVFMQLGFMGGVLLAIYKHFISRIWKIPSGS